MAFGGFTDEAFSFYEGLQGDNSKPYWTSHKETYERHVREPLTELCAELEDEFGAVKLFRPYRDVRFSKDKTPYKTHQGGHTAEGFYIQIDADGLMVAGGMYAPTPDQAHTGWPADPWAADPDEVRTRVRTSWRRLRPLVDWGREHIGPPDFTR